MSKYQAALDELSIPLDDCSCSGCKCGTSDCGDCKKAQAVFTLQELVEKDKMKEAILVHDYDGYVFECPVCGEEFRPNYILKHITWDGCPYCRQKLHFNIERK